MFGFAVFNGVAGVLQLVVPAYALRLVRRFGTRRVGWFVVLSFLALALLHLVAPMRPGAAPTTAGLKVEFVYAISSVLLLIGMCHIETRFSEQEEILWKEENIRNESEAHLKQKIASLTRINETLYQEVARREQIEKALAQSEGQYRLLFTENPVPMWIFDLRSCGFLALNNAALSQYGYSHEEMAARTIRDLMPEDAVLEFLHHVGKPCPEPQSLGLWQHCRRDGTMIDVEVTAVDIKYGGCQARLILALDISQRWRHELRFRKAQKMEAISQVAGGVAYHFNPIMSVIDSQTNSLLRSLPDENWAEPLKQISAIATRGSILTRQLLAVAGQHEMRLEALDLNEVVRNLNHMLRRLVGSDIILQNKYGSAMPLAWADQHLLEQVMINLTLNAREAMANGGTLTLSTTGLRINESEKDDRVRTGEFVRLTIADTGCGIPSNVQSRLFEPFFTTKQSENGTGLGLASAYGALRQMSGWIECSSEVGVGTEFRIYLPCAPANATRSEHPVAQTAAPTTSATILLVEANDRMRGLARCILDWNGYRVIEADSASIALVLWEGQASDIDVVIIDADLPGDITGNQLLQTLRTARPDLRVIYTCNRNSDGTTPEAADGMQFVAKPYSSEKLLLTVQQLLT